MSILNSWPSTICHTEVDVNWENTKNFMSVFFLEQENNVSVCKTVNIYKKKNTKNSLKGMSKLVTFS